MMRIGGLWECSNAQKWAEALDRYWCFVPPWNLELERSLDELDLERLRQLDAQGWYDFLHNEYFRWKYTAKNRYATTTTHLRRYVGEHRLGDLDRIRHDLLTLDTDDIRRGLLLASAIKGLGAAGASGLLALMYPTKFGTVDQFVVKALKQVTSLLEAAAVAQMNPDSLTIKDGVLIIEILRRKAAANNHLFNSTTWTPRNIDKVLWTCGR